MSTGILGQLIFSCEQLKLPFKRHQFKIKQMPQFPQRNLKDFTHKSPAVTEK